MTIGDSVTSIGDWAFYNCAGLTSVTIPDSVTSIEYGAFSDCTGLTSVYYTGDIAGWCGIDGLDNIKGSGRTLYIGGQKIEGELIIPDSVTEIKSYAFYNCTGLTSVTIGNSVTSIGSYAFRDCTGLTEINWNAVSVAGLYGNVFFGAGTAGDGITVTFGDSVEKIPANAFYNCTGLTSVTIGSSVTSIGSSAFRDCTGLTSVTIGDSVTSIGVYAFQNCKGLTSVVFEDTEGWQVSRNFSRYTSLSSADIANTSTAAEYLRSTYYYYYWRKVK